MTIVSDINFTTTRLEILDNGKAVGHATGFFFKFAEIEYLVTNRHVVQDETKGFLPSHLRMYLHANRDNLTENYQVDVKLSEKARPLWLQHAQYKTNSCDVVIIPMSKETLEPPDFIRYKKSSIITFGDTQLQIPDVNSFGDVVVIGYPLGFFDMINNLPVSRKAMIASPYSINFMGKPYFLIDANLHPGTSGSPVVNSHHTLFMHNEKREGYVLFGIHSAEHYMGDEPLGLNVVWYSRLLLEIINPSNS